MNERVIELYKQAVTFAHNIAGKDAGKGTIIESLTAGKFAELILEEVMQELFINGYDDAFDYMWGTKVMQRS